MSEKQCPTCKGRGVVYNWKTNQYDKVCPTCNGAGTVAR